MKTLLFLAFLITAFPVHSQGATRNPLPARELDRLLAPVALYPDELLSQILMAATYPLQVVEAARWVKVPDNSALTGDDLASALDRQDWDPSVKSLVPFPDILRQMNDHIDWMQELGNAFLDQQADVMDSVQRLRQRALAAGTLNSNAQQMVVTGGDGIEVDPADSDTIYVPQYDPGIAYGAWPYPTYPPFYLFPPTPAYASGIYYGSGIAIVGTLWGWNSFDWGHHRISIDRERYRRIDAGHRRFDNDYDERYRRGGADYRHFRGQTGYPVPSGKLAPARTLAPGLAPAISPGMLSPAERPSHPLVHSETRKDGERKGGSRREHEERGRESDVRK